MIPGMNLGRIVTSILQTGGLSNPQMRSCLRLPFNLLKGDVFFRDKLTKKQILLKFGQNISRHHYSHQQKCGGQRIMVVGINNYAYLIPYVEEYDEMFLKTIIPSRKATERYFGGKHED